MAISKGDSKLKQQHPFISIKTPYKNHTNNAHIKETKINQKNLIFVIKGSYYKATQKGNAKWPSTLIILQKAIRRVQK
jgi:hypothetical protein